MFLPDASKLCGNGKIDPPEQCDGTNFGTKTCKTEGFHGGTLQCHKCILNTSKCYKCGDGKITPPEQCDGTNLGSKTCKTEGFTGGSLTCDKCLLDKSLCYKCGDGKITPPEQCDGTNFGSKTCKTEGFDSGQLTCNACKIDTSTCAKCGDSKITPPEQCDGTNFGTKTCKTQGFTGGSLTCNKCVLDTSKCTKCGDGKITSPEECDGTNFGTKTCKTQGFTGGTLTCNTCKIDTSNCTKCGDGKITSPEECDGTNIGSASCTAKSFQSGTPGCNNCKLDYGYCRMYGYYTVSAGGFYMGSSGGSSDPCKQSNEDRHYVTLTNPYEIQTIEAIQSGFQNAMGYNPSQNKKGGSYPVEYVNWHEAAAFCDAGSTITGLENCYNCTGSTSSVKCTVVSKYTGSNIYNCPGFRLPTEAEWEKAARAGSSTNTHKGNIKNCTTADSVADAAGWYSGNSYSYGTRGVGSKKNGWGISDMCGNVFEWMHDYYVANHGSGSATNPGGPTSGSQHAIRSGAYNSQAQALRVTSRGPHPKTSRYGVIGFRCVRTVK